jgi:hypothetical protein
MIEKWSQRPRRPASHFYVKDTLAPLWPGVHHKTFDTLSGEFKEATPIALRELNLRASLGYRRIRSNGP